MLEKLMDRLKEARARLLSALESGQPTQAHREAIAKLEVGIEVERSKLEMDATRAAELRHEAIVVRAGEIAARARQGLDDLLSSFPIPEYKQ